MRLKTFKDIDVRNKTVLLRVDFNIETVNADSRGQEHGLTRTEISPWEEFKMKNIFPTLEYLLKRKCRIILLSHRGRPKGRDTSFSLEAIFQHFEMLIRNSEFAGRIQNIFFVPSVYQIKPEVLKPCTIAVSENLRFQKGEEIGDIKFAKFLASLGECYVNDAFSVVHRKDASVSKLPLLLPSAAGLALEKEFRTLHQLIVRPRRPFTVILAGGKADTKFPLISEFLKRSDFLFVGGTLANTIFESAGYPTGASLFEKKYVNHARQFVESPRISFLENDTDRSLVIARSAATKQSPGSARDNEIASQSLAMTEKEDLVVNFEKVYGRNLRKVRHRLLLPFDVGIGIIEKRTRKDVIVSPSMQIGERESILDIGPRTSAFLAYLVKRSGEVLWNGPLGYFEDKTFAVGTRELVRSINRFSTKVVIGGGETVAAFYQFGGRERRNVAISSGGGAMLEFFLNQKLPGLVPLMK